MNELEDRSYWYKFFIEECVICGKTTEWKERQFTPKPKDASERYCYTQNACSTHFV